MKLFIKYMVSVRCKMVVKSILEELNIPYEKIELGEVELKSEILRPDLVKFGLTLQKSGLELIEDRKSILVEKIKNTIVEMIHYKDEMGGTKNSYYISKKLNHNYNYLANLFSEVTGSSIAHYIIAHKIEKAKELLVYYELPLSEIAWKLHYSSAAHLSNQFKKITGITPSSFKKLEEKKLIPLEYVGMKQFVA